MAEPHLEHPRPVGIIDTIDDDFAVVLVGHDQEAWHFRSRSYPNRQPREACSCCVVVPARWT
jgi:hypothetical protein